jgi:DNA ligase-1
MLAKPTTSVAEILAKFDGSPIVAQFKYDGERAQIHWNAETQEMFVFSRNGENSTAKYASVRDALLASLRDRRDSCVIDGEMLAVELLPDGSRRILPFQTLMKRAKKERAKDSARAAKASEEEA